MAWIVKIDGDIDKREVRRVREVMGDHSADYNSLNMSIGKPRRIEGKSIKVFTNVYLKFKWSWMAADLKKALEQRVGCRCELKQVSG